MKKYLAMLLAAAMLLTMLAGCGSSAAASTETASASAASASEQAEEPAAEEAAPAEEPAPAEEASAAEGSAAEPAEAADDGVIDNTEANANFDYTAHKELLKSLTTELPVTDEDVTLTYFFGCENNILTYLPDGTMSSHQVWQWLSENTGVTLELTTVDKTTETDKFNLMIASGDYTDLLNIGDYTNGTEAAYNEDVIEDLSGYLEEYMPNYWAIINSDSNVFSEVQDADMNLRVYPVKNMVANPSGIGTFIRKDWLDDLGMEVPQTYDELTEVLRAFKTEEGAAEPMALFNTVSLQNGLLCGGFGSKSELSADAMGTDFGASFYQVDGEVIYGATADGTRKYLSWLHQLYTEDLINFENMQNRETNPFGDLNAGTAADGTNGYIFSNQPFGGNYSTMAAEQYNDSECNWWPVQDVAEEAGATIPFYEENSLVDTTGASAISISTQCENIEVALAFLDYGYSYEGSILYNFGFEIGSGEGQYETWSYDADGNPTFDSAALTEVAPSTNEASGVVATKDLAGVVFDDRLSFEFGERELSCMEAWSTNKNTSENLGSDVVLTGEEMTDASAIYSDIITYVGTCALQFINGDLDVDGDDWDDYVSKIDDMNIAGLTEIVQGAYDRVNG